jgi:formylglycine-generating enzyme required for sulfatase activity
MLRSSLVSRFFFFFGFLILVLFLLDRYFFHFLEAAPDEMVLIPAGPFVMGSDKKDLADIGKEFGLQKPLYLDEHPQRTVSLPAFYMDRYEATNADYSRFVQAVRYRAPHHWEGGNIPAGQERYPVTQVSWYDAREYCQWQGKRLPSEAEWEKTARGTNGREFPWGDTFNPTRANVGMEGTPRLMPVGSFKESQSPYGAADLAGNVWEWVEDWYRAYPEGDYQSDFFGSKYKVLRGGSYGGSGHYHLPVFYRGAFRTFADPALTFPDVGVRCAKNP